MSERKDSYKIVIYTKRHPDSLHGPEILRKLISVMSEVPTTYIYLLKGTPLDKAQKIASENTNSDGYVDGEGNLRTSRGVVYKSSDLY